MYNIFSLTGNCILFYSTIIFLGDVILTTYGRIITTRYGTSSDISSNGVESRIIRYDKILQWWLEFAFLNTFGTS